MRQILVLALLLLCPIVTRAQDERRDGNWWNEQAKPWKIAYVTGFFDGMELGQRFSYWGSIDKNSGNLTACGREAGKSFDDFAAKFFSHVSNYQLVDGLGDFYKDYRNRSIKIHDGVWIVVNTIAGTPQDGSCRSRRV